MPGDIDKTFNGIGYVTTSITNETTQAWDIAIQSDGKIIVVGDSSDNSNIDFAVIRYNTDGTLDTTFDNDGIVTTAIGLINESARGVALQMDGKIVVAGYSDDPFGNSNFAVVRYNPDGSLDTTFSSDGMVTTPIGSSSDFGEDVAIQTDGKIIVSGRYLTGGNSNEDFAIVRYNSNGTLDTTFDFDGKATTAVGIGKEGAMSVIVQPDGKIVAGGFANTSLSSDFQFYDYAVVRYNTNGTLDLSFGSNGKVTTPVGNLADLAFEVRNQSDGKIILTGLTNNGSDFDFATVRYNLDGSLDSTFGKDGKLITDLGNHESANSSAIQNDGKIIVIGGSGSFTLIRYNLDGSLDRSNFGTDGIVQTSIGSAKTVAIQPDGKIVVAGIIYNGNVFSIVVARYIGGDVANTASATISGRILSPTGRAIPRAFVQITNQNNNTQTVIANSSGYYHFEFVETGQTITIRVISTQFYFQTKVITVNGNLININFSGTYNSEKELRKKPR